MPKPLSNKCQMCAKLPVAQAKIIHGEEGDGCWAGQKCYNKRTFYRNRDKYKQERAKSNPMVELVEVEPPEDYFAVIYLYKEPGDKPLHGLKTELWKGQKPICRTEPIHCFGLTNGKIRAYSEQVLEEFSNKYGIKLNQFKEKFEISPLQCPLQCCPLKN